MLKDIKRHKIGTLHFYCRYLELGFLTLFDDGSVMLIVWLEMLTVPLKIWLKQALEGVEEVDGTFLLDPTSTATEEDDAVVLHFFWEPAVEEDGVVAAVLPFENGGTSAVAVFDPYKLAYSQKPYQYVYTS